jgi:hypothetical protein
MVFHSDEGNRFAYIPKDWTDELSSQHRSERYDVCSVGKMYEMNDPSFLDAQPWSNYIEFTEDPLIDMKR